jgi:zinc protease
MKRQKLFLISSTALMALSGASFVTSAFAQKAGGFVKPVDIKALREPAKTGSAKAKIKPATVPAVPPRANLPQPVKRVLPNGLTVLVLENRAAPVVAVRAYVRTGSIYEGQHLGSGISHLFEHVLSEGTTNRTKQQMDDEVQAIGGQSNAYTSYDVTAYHLTTASQYFQKALELTADQLQNATFPEKEVKTQIGVIHNEMNMGEDDPDRVLYKLFYSTAFQTHPVSYPVIGHREIFDKLSREDIVNYYKSHYTPGNTVLSIAGDVNARYALDAAEDAFKGWERRAPATPVLPQEPRQTTRRRAVVEKPIGQTYMMMGWHTVPLQHPDLYALDVLAQILGGGESSRLVRTLREKENLVTSIAAWSSTPNYNAGVFAIRAEMPPQNLDKAGKQIWNETTRLWTEKVSADELSTAKRQIESNFIFSNQEVDAQAEQIAYDELGTGDPTFSRSYVQRIKAVTAEQVLEVAKKYLTRDGFSTALVVPNGKGQSVAATSTTVASVKPPQMVSLPNGMRLIIRENHSAPTVSIVVQGLGGSRLEPANKPGVANLFAELLTRSTRVNSYETIAAKVDALGGSLSSFSGYNSWGVDSSWLKQDWKTGFHLVAQSFTLPAFSEDDISRVKQQVLAALQQQEDEPEIAAGLLLRRTYFGSHPYGRSPLGTIASVQKIGRKDLSDFWAKVMLPKEIVIAVYGAVDAGEVRRVAEDQFKNFKREGTLPAPPAPPATLSQFTTSEIKKPGIQQAVLYYGYPGIDVRNADRYAVDVLDAALSGSSLPGGRLHARLRDNQLVYYVHAYDSPGLDPGMFVVYAGTTKDKLDEVKNIIAEEIKKAREANFSAEELERAKSMAISAAAIARQSNSAQAREAAGDELFGLGYRNADSYAARINAITLEDVRRMAEKYLRPESAAYAAVQPE